MVSAAWLYSRQQDVVASHTDLFGEVLHDAVLGHLGADGEAPLQLFLDARDHFLVLLRSEALHS